MSNNSESVSKFQTHFETKLKMVQELPANPRWDPIRKLLYITIIDSIAGVIFPKKGNHDRFCTTVTEFGDWEHASYFSMPFLQRHLKLINDPYFEKLREVIDPVFNLWLDIRSFDRYVPWVPAPGPRMVVPLKADVPPEAIHKTLGKVPNDEFKKIAKFQHASLLHTYRNSLVHSLLIPGLNDRPEVPSEPYYEIYYICFPSNGEGEAFQDLIYPNHFLKELSERVLENSVKHLEARNKDPWKEIQSSRATYWDKRLNDGIGTLGEALFSSLRENPRPWHPGGEALPPDQWLRTAAPAEDKE